MFSIKDLKKKIVFVILGIILLIAGILIMVNMRKPTLDENALWDQYEVIFRTIEGKNLRLVVADTPERQRKGLMFVRKPVEDFDGMIFIFPDKEKRNFWNMNTFEDLKLYWMDDEIIVGVSDLPSIEKSNDIVTVSSPKPVNIVVEIIQ